MTMLVDKNQYLTAGIHIGMKTCTPYLKQFVYKIREDGLAVFNLQLVDERIKTAARFLAGFPHIAVVSRKEAAGKAIEQFASVTGSTAIAGRFAPGTFTNPAFRGFMEPDAVLVVDPLVDDQAVKEAKRKRIPVVALCDTFNLAKDIDFVIPSNNNGRRSLALVFWILARELMKHQEKIKKDADFKPTLKDFGDEEKEPRPEQEEPAGRPRRTEQDRKPRGRRPVRL